MNYKVQSELIKRVLSSHSLKYSLRGYTSQLSRIETLSEDKQKDLSNIDEDAAEFKFYSRQISFDDYCQIKTTYSKDAGELITKSHALISKENLIQLLQMKETGGQWRFCYLLLQKLSEHIGDMTIQDILRIQPYLRFEDEKIKKFHFNLIAERILEVIHLVTTDQLIQLLNVCGKFDAPSDNLWQELSKMFLFRIQDLSLDQLITASKGFSGANRGNEILWKAIIDSFLQKSQNMFNNPLVFEFSWVVMKAAPENEQFWLFINQQYSQLLKVASEQPNQFMKLFKYSIKNTFRIEIINQGELFDLLLEIRPRLSATQTNKILTILAKEKLLTPKIAEAFDHTLPLLPTSIKQNVHF